jgi:hypothetical protein
MSVSSDQGAEVTEGICHGLHPPSILSGEICLDKLAESGVQVENLDLVVVEELGLDSNPGLASGPPRSRTLSCISTLRVPRIQVRATLSIRDQACVDTIASVRTWSSRA